VGRPRLATKTSPELQRALNSLLGPKRPEAWQRFCEAMGTRCAYVGTDGRCENAVSGQSGRCADHQGQR
jgi:hypothetical protein